MSQDKIDRKKNLDAPSMQTSILAAIATAKAQNRFVSDRATGLMEKNADGKLAIAKVYLRPQAIFAGDNLPTDKQIEEMHSAAHHSCFLANSVKTEIIVQAIAF